MNYEKTLTIRLSAREMEAIEQQAEQLCLAVSDIVRHCIATQILGEPYVKIDGRFKHNRPKGGKS